MEEVEVVDITPKNINDEFVVKYHFENHQTHETDYKSEIIISHE